MRFLPPTFPTGSLSAIEIRRLEYYYEHYVIRLGERYGFGHFALACYAALPAVLTPDLLNKIWLNFKTYYDDDVLTVIHPVAPVDLLLSPLVEEIGFEIYEMPEAIRQALLLYLKETTIPGANPYRLYSLEAIASFLQDYTQHDFTPENADDDAFREAQEWTALSYLDPGKAFSSVAQAFQKADTNPLRLRYKDAMEKMSARFALEIVKDASAIPSGFKAMTALTSVVRDVLMKREPKKLEELKGALKFDNDLLTEKPILRDDIINIEIPGEVDRIIQLPIYNDSSKKRKVKALVIGMEQKDAANAELFANAIKELIPADELEIMLFSFLQRETSKFNVLDELAKIVESSSDKDDLLVYIAAGGRQDSGHCITVDNDPLKDEDFGYQLNSANCASITLVLEIDHAATPYWLDTTQPNRCVFASCKYNQDVFDDQPPVTKNSRNRPPTGRHYSPFTHSLVEAMLESGMQVSNRNLFLTMLQHYEKKMEEHRRYGIETWRTKAPQLLSNPSGYRQLFIQGNNKRAQLQDLLRQTGFYDHASNGKWDKETAVAYTAYRRGTQILKQRFAPADPFFPERAKTKNELIAEIVAQLQNPLLRVLNGLAGRHTTTTSAKKARRKKRPLPPLSLGENISALEQLNQTNNGNQPPVFMLIFSDPGNELKELEEEKRMIRQHLEIRNPAFNIELAILDQPGAHEIIEAFSSKAYRNRIRFCYYGGTDDNGNFRLADEEKFDFIEFGRLLDYQENMQLFVSNTCNSSFFSDYLTQLGVQNAIGSEDFVYDNYCLQFAIELYDALASGKDIEEVSKLFIPGNETSGEYYGSSNAL